MVRSTMAKKTVITITIEVEGADQNIDKQVNCLVTDLSNHLNVIHDDVSLRNTGG